MSSERRVAAYAALVPASMGIAFFIAMALYFLVPFVMIDSEPGGAGWRWSIVLLTWAWTWFLGIVLMGIIYVTDWALTVLDKKE